MFTKDGHSSVHSRTVPGFASIKPGTKTMPAIPKLLGRMVMGRFTEPGIPLPREDKEIRSGTPVVVRRLSNYVHTDVEPEVILLTRRKDG